MAHACGARHRLRIQVTGDRIVQRSSPHATVGLPTVVRFRATDCDDTLLRIEAPGVATRIVRFPCPAPRARFTWTPTKPGSYALSAIAHGDGTTAKTTTRLTVERATR